MIYLVSHENLQFISTKSREFSEEALIRMNQFSTEEVGSVSAQAFSYNNNNLLLLRRLHVL